jgi:energy-coupling factor transport system ATP-binding protein
VIHFDNITFTYPGTQQPVLRQVKLDIREGEFCLVFGPSGGGKSTLLRCINGLVPHFSGGLLEGAISVNGLDPVKLSTQGMSREVGFVFQDPEAQFVVDRVEDEIAFALENLAMPPAEMRERVESVLQLLELSALRKRRLETLSGGEKQRVAIAAALVLRPRILVLDEPTSQLDPHAAEEVLLALRRLNRELGLTIVLVEQRLERVLPFATCAVYLEAGKTGVIAGEPREVLRQVPINSPVVALGKLLGWQPLPLTVEEARQFAHQLPPTHAVHFNQPEDTDLHAPSAQNERKQFLRAEGLEVSYSGQPALRGVSVELNSHEIAVLMGPNGSGKTTLLRCLVSLIKPQAGTVWVDGESILGKPVAEVCRRVGYLPQDPNALLFADTVEEELLVTLHNHGRTPQANELAKLLEQLGLGDKATAYPRDLSSGERQRVALGAVLVAKPGALLLDEPTRGLDYAAKRELLKMLLGWRDHGMAILLVTHDVELAAEAADRVIILEEGLICANGSPLEVLAASERTVPQMAKVFAGQGMLTVREVVERFNRGNHR